MMRRTEEICCNSIDLFQIIFNMECSQIYGSNLSDTEMDSYAKKWDKLREIQAKTLKCLDVILSIL